MAAPGVSGEEGKKRTRARARPVRRSSGGSTGAIQTILGLALALVIFGVIYLVMQNSGMGDRNYWNAYRKTITEIQRSQNMSPDEVWNRAQALPTKDIRDPKLLELHQALIDYATVIRDADDYTRRGKEVEERLSQLEIEAAQKLGVPIEQR